MLNYLTVIKHLLILYTTNKSFTYMFNFWKGFIILTATILSNIFSFTNNMPFISAFYYSN